MQIFLRPVLLFFTLVFAIQVHGQTPVADFSATPITGCAPLIVQFTSISTGNPTSYQWNLGNGVNTVQQNPSTAYTQPGTYTVTLTVSNANGSNTKTVTNYITVVANPTVSFAAVDSNGCPPFVAQFNNSTNLNAPGSGTYSWSFGDGAVATAASPTHTYAAPGLYTVTLVATNSVGCAATMVKPAYITVFTPPVANFSATPTSYCGTPATISFAGSAIGTGPHTYDWDFGDGGIGVGAFTSHTYTTSGIYTVRLIVTDANGCRDTVLKPGHVSIGSIVANFNTTPAAGCVNAPIQFNNTSNGGVSFAWDFGDGTTSAVANPTHSYAAPGVYNVKLAIYDGPCGDSVTKQVTVNPGPTPNFTYSPNQPCPPPTTISFTNLTSSGVSYTWDFGDGGTSNATSPTHNYVQKGFYPVKLTATNALGCQSIYIDTVKVNDLHLGVSPVSASGCAPLLVNFNAFAYSLHPVTNAITPYPATSYSWSFGDGGVAAVQSPSHTYVLSNNTYTVNVSVQTTNGCNQSNVISVSVGDKPTASFIGYPDTVCVNTQVNFINTTTDTTQFTFYTWYMGDGQTVSTKHANYSYSFSGYYNVSLVADNYGCKDTFRVDTAAVVNAPTALWVEAYNCDTPLMVRFYDTLSIRPTSHIWYFGDGTSDTATNPTHVYPALGVYNVSLVTFNSSYGCSDTSTRSIELVSPVLSFVTADTAICRGDSIVFVPSYTHTPALYTWYINGAAPPWPFAPFSNPNPSSGAWGHRFNTRGIYDISVTTTDIHGCKDSAFRDDYILVAKPQALFSGAPTLGCVPLTVLFKDTSTNVPGAFQVTRNWTFGNGTATVNTDTTSRVYTTAGLFTPVLIVTDNVGCSDTLAQSNYIEVRKPTAAFSVNDSVACVGQNLIFTSSATGNGLTYYWDFGDGSNATATSPTKSYAQPGTYAVKLIVTDASGCMDSLTLPGNISINKPTASFTMSDTQAICPPLTVLITNQSQNAVSYLWSFGNGSGSILPSPSVIYSSPGVYPVSLIVTDVEGCTDTAFNQVNVLGYAGGLSYAPLTGCNPLQVNFTTNIFGVPSMIWDFNDGVTQPVVNNAPVSHTYITPGAYLPKLILSDNAGCTNSSLGIDTIKVDEVTAGFVTTSACVNTPTVFTDTSHSLFQPISSWLWDFDGQGNSTSGSPSYTFTAVGTYTVTLIAKTAWGCVDTVTRTVTVNELPIITAGYDTTICSGDPTELAAFGGVSYNWAPATNLSCVNCQNPVATPTVTTNYVVTGTDANGCSNKDSAKIAVRYYTTSEVAPGGEICADSIFRLSAYGADRYEWTPPFDLDDHQKPDPIASPQTTTTYMVRAWEAGCLADTNFVTVIVHPKPDIDAGENDTAFAGKEVVLIASSSEFVTFLWDASPTLNCTNCSAPIATPRATTSYRVTATSAKGCKNSDSVTVFIFCHNDQVFIPNTFTPNGDGQNDVFYPRGIGMKAVRSLRIYNRWGEVVFERRNFLLNDRSAGWDGTYKGQELNTDIFVYSIDGICDSGETLNWKGDITLIR